MGKKKVVLDTNILISALGWEGNPKIVFNKVLNGELDLIISDRQLSEIIRVLNYPKFNFNDEEKIRFINILLSISTLIKLNYVLDFIKEDKDDNIILTSAINGKADFIITGDEHLLKLKEFKNIKILKANDFLKAL